MSYDNLPEEQPRRTLGLQCLHKCQGMEPKCLQCPKEYTIKERTFWIACGLLAATFFGFVLLCISKMNEV